MVFLAHYPNMVFLVYNGNKVFLAYYRNMVLLFHYKNMVFLVHHGNVVVHYTVHCTVQQSRSFLSRVYSKRVEIRDKTT